MEQTRVITPYGSEVLEYGIEGQKGTQYLRQVDRFRMVGGMRQDGEDV